MDLTRLLQSIKFPRTKIKKKLSTLLFSLKILKKKKKMFAEEEKNYSHSFAKLPSWSRTVLALSNIGNISNVKCGLKPEYTGPTDRTLFGQSYSEMKKKNMLKGS